MCIRDRWYITLPSMKNILLFGCVMQIQSTFSVSYVATTLTGWPSTNYCTETIVTHLTDVGTVRFEMGYAAAISVFLFILMAVTRVLIGKPVSYTHLLKAVTLAVDGRAEMPSTDSRSDA